MANIYPASSTETALTDKDLTVTEIVLRAGNADNEKLRYQLLQGLLNRDPLDGSIQKDLKTLLPAIDAWANGREKMMRGEFKKKYVKDGYLSGFFDDYTRLDNDFPGYIAKDSLLYPVWCMYRGRFLVWIQVESDDPKTRDQYFSEARKLFKTASGTFPDNRILRMYLGEPIPWPTDFQPDPNAPRWANLQREGLEKLADIIYWWIDHRQLPNGPFGGKWNDDIEMWRWWATLLIGFKDQKIIDAQTRLSRNILNRRVMKNGYSSKMNDVEHTAEVTADTLTPMMHLQPNSPEWKKRTERLAELMRTKWTGLNERGFLQFKSAYFNVHEVDLNPQHAADTVFHPRAVQPALLYWQRTGDPSLKELFSSWMDTWVDAAAREERGKPAGILPSAIHWPDGRIGGKDGYWWKPEIYWNDMYAWPSRMGIMTKTLLLTYHMTDDERYLQPILSMFRIGLQHKNNPPKGEPQPGTAAWCATSGGLYNDGMQSFLPQTMAKYRLLTNDDAFDREFLRSTFANGYIKMRLGVGDKTLVQELEKNAKAFRMNKPVYTSEVRYTDRVLSFTHRWYNRGNGRSYPTPNIDLLYSTATGDPGDHGYFPMNTVRWLTHPRAFAALVTDGNRRKFEARLYHFGETDRDMGSEFFLLKAGNYLMTLTDADGNLISKKRITAKAPVLQVSFVLPPRKLCRLQVLLSTEKAIQKR
ncbi:hypothetical protein ACFL6B_05255 [Thermodesulfobacteriota bacterium]